MRQANSHTMTRFSQPSFLQGASRPLVLTMQWPRESPLDFYRKDRLPPQPSFPAWKAGRARSRRHYSFFGSGPSSILPTTPALCHRIDLRRIRSHGFGTVFSLRPASNDLPGLPPFFGGAVGYFSYDFVRRLETLPSVAIDDLSLPDLHIRSVRPRHRHRSSDKSYPSSSFVRRWNDFSVRARDKLYREGLDRLTEWEARLTRHRGVAD